MITIDERDIDAARFCKHVQTIWVNTTGRTPEGGLRLAALCLFLQMRERHGFPFLEPQGIADSYQLRDWRIKLHQDFGIRDLNRSEWDDVSSDLLRHFQELVGFEHDHLVLLRRLDFIVERLNDTLGKEHAVSRRIERFVAAFVTRWDALGGSVIDLSGSTNGEIGIALQARGAMGAYYLSLANTPLRFEVCLRLRAHGVRFADFSDRSEDEIAHSAQAVYGYPARRLSSRLRSAAMQRDDGRRFLAESGGLEIVHRFLRSGPKRRAVIIVPTSELRVGGWRAALRVALLEHGQIHGVIDLPKRVSGGSALSMVVAASHDWQRIRPEVLLLNGRALDGLRDEPLEQLAQFLSFPFGVDLALGGIDRLERADERLSEALQDRAHKMFRSGLSEAPGLFRYESVEAILRLSNASLRASDWIPERSVDRAGDLLDATPLHGFLGVPERACCLYIIGNNGTGKSMLLRQLASAYGDRQRAVRAVASAPTDRFATRMRLDHDYIYLGARTGVGGTQPRLLGRQLAELVKSIHDDPDKVRVFEAILELLLFSGHYFLLPETADSDFLESIREFGRDVIDDDLRGWKLGFRKPDSHTIIPFDHLSTGEQQILLLVAKLVAHAAKDVLFLVDEPETSLHVGWQRALPTVFEKVSQRFCCQIVIATHSPVLISTAHGDQSYCFKAGGGVLDLIDERAASSVERVLFQGFNIYTENNREVHERCAELVSDAIGAVNRSTQPELQNLLDELEQMKQKVAISQPMLEATATALPLDLIEKAQLAITELRRSVEPAVKMP
ncbi:hypothetical protein Brsp05_04515 [Brucella sp. NBRC 12953]|uniref:AAA family ATPase n=1 Tax=Brucella sp. NBRC 12953 TaxID=3075481 RepID=UPI0030B77627